MKYKQIDRPSTKKKVNSKLLLDVKRNIIRTPNKIKSGLSQITPLSLFISHHLFKSSKDKKVDWPITTLKKVVKVSKTNTSLIEQYIGREPSQLKRKKTSHTTIKLKLINAALKAMFFENKANGTFVYLFHLSKIIKKTNSSPKSSKVSGKEKKNLDKNP